MNVPMVDLAPELPLIEAALEAGFRETLRSGRYILGPNVEAFEREAASYLGVKHALGVANGTDALHLAVAALGIGRGDEVITPAFTFIATGEAIAYTGATPVFVDVDPRTFNVDPAAVAAAIGPRTKAILPVHLFGQAADMDALGALAARHGLALVEDCAQAFGADWRGRKCGALGTLGCHSFYPSKNLGCFGDGGMVTTDDDALAARVRVLRNHGSRETYRHEVIGYNSRLDELQAVVLRAKLPLLDRFNGSRQAHARRYTAALAGLALATPAEHGDGRHIYHQYTLRLAGRDALKSALAAAGIASAIYYPIPLHRQQAFAELPAVELPVAERLAREVLSLPMYPGLRDDQVDRIVQAVAASVAAVHGR